MSPRTGLCDGLQYNACQKEEAKELLRKFEDHLTKPNQKEITTIKYQTSRRGKKTSYSQT